MNRRVLFAKSQSNLYFSGNSFRRTPVKDLVNNIWGIYKPMDMENLSGDFRILVLKSMLYLYFEFLKLKKFWSLFRQTGILISGASI